MLLPGSVKVAMITRDYPPVAGGISTHTHSLVRGLAELGFRVDVFIGSTDLRTLLVPFKRAVRRGDYGLVHVQSSPYGAFVTRHPMIVTVHSPVAEERKHYAFGNAWKVPFAHFLEKRSLNKADGVIAVSEETRQMLVRYYGVPENKVFLVPNGVDSESFVPDKDQMDSPPRVLLCSRLDRRKNVSQALLALSELSGIQYDVRIVGDGPERKSLERLARIKLPKAEFLGQVSDGELHSVFAKSDIFLTCSFSEGFGLSLLQAMAAGCAVVASDIPTHRELVTHARDGFLYTGTSELILYLRMLLEDRSLVRKLGTEAREKALEYSWDRTAERTARVYDLVLARGRRPGTG